MQGTTDLQITRADAQLLATARPGLRLELIAGMNHVLKPAPEDRACNLATYGDPHLQLAPALIPLLADWILALALGSAALHCPGTRR